MRSGKMCGIAHRYKRCVFHRCTLMPADMPRLRVAPASEHIMPYTHMVVTIDQIRPHPRNARTHSKKQCRQIATSIRALGFAAPILIDENKILIAGHGRLEAAKSLGMSSIPAIVVLGLVTPRSGRCF